MLTIPRKIASRGLRYCYLRIFKEFPTGLHGRQDKADEYIASYNHPTIKTYYDYFKSIEDNDSQDLIVRPTLNESQQIESLAIMVNFSLARLHVWQQFLGVCVVGDEQLVEDIESKSLMKVIKECFDAKARTPLHEYLMSATLALFAVFCIYIPVRQSLESKKAKFLASGSQFGNRYNPRQMAHAISLYAPKIDFLNKHLSEVVESAKQESLSKEAIIKQGQS